MNLDEFSRYVRYRTDAVSVCCQAALEERAVTPLARE